MGSTVIGAISYPENVDQPLVPAHLKQAAEQIMQTAVPRFNSTAERTAVYTTLGVTPTTGAMCYLASSARYEMWNGTAWVAFAPQSTWTPLTLLASWVNRGAGHTVASYRKILGDTTLQLQMDIASGTTTAATTIFTLPVGFRPVNAVQIGLIGRIASAPQQMAALEITSDGNAKIYDVGAATVLQCSGIVPLDL